MTATKAVNVVPRGIEVTGKTAVTWAVAGGVTLGGFVVGIMTLSGQLSGNGLLLTSMALFIIGGVLGFMHGAVLGVMGRPAEVTPRKAAVGLVLALMYTIPALTVAFLVAGWIALTPIAFYTGKPLAIAGSLTAWLVGAGLLAMAAVTGWRALRAAYARWEDHMYGTVIVAASFAALLVLFMAARPVIWGIDLRVTETGAVLLAAALTLWVVGPMVTIALKLMPRIALPGRLFDTPERVMPGLAIGLLAGVVLGLIAIPFADPKYGIASAADNVGPIGALVFSLSAALVNEVLLRLFVVSAVAALVLRWHNAQRDEAAALAIVIATIAQVLLYLPGVVATGFPNALSAVAFVTVAVAVPAAVFGVIFWKRGFASAVVADATALLALALLAA